VEGAEGAVICQAISVSDENDSPSGPIGPQAHKIRKCWTKKKKLTAAAIPVLS
jgi:hypothetical protein